MPVLHLTLYRKWFDLIAAGSKGVEYRQDSDHWHKRIFNDDGSNKHFDTIHFRNGYGKHRPLMVAEFVSAFVTHSDLCACANGEKLDGRVIVIAIGKKIRFENYQPPWSCAGCGVLVSLEESLCPACTAQLCGGGLSWTDDLGKKVEVS